MVEKYRVNMSSFSVIIFQSVMFGKMFLVTGDSSSIGTENGSMAWLVCKLALGGRKKDNFDSVKVESVAAGAKDVIILLNRKEKLQPSMFW